MGQRHYSLRNFPRVIETTTRAIEVQAAQGNGKPKAIEPGQRGTWLQLCRVPAKLLLNLPLTSTAVHVFGNSRDPAACSLMLCYDCDGVVDSVLVRGNDDNQFHQAVLPTELTSKITRHPAARLIFKDKEARDKFIDELPPELLDLLVGDPVAVDAGVENDDHDDNLRPPVR